MNRWMLWISPLLLLATPAAATPGFVFTPDAVERSSPPSRTLVKALELYERKDFYSVTILLHKVIEGETGDSLASRQRAEFWMAKALVHLRFYSAALAAFDRIVKAGDQHRYRAATLRWLASLSRRLPESTGILGLIGSYSSADLERPALLKVRDELRYLIGRHRYRQGRFDEATDLFRAVSPGSPFYRRARYVEGIAHARRGKDRQASAAFGALLAHVRAHRGPGRGAPGTRRMEELAVLALARTHFSLRQFDRSLRYYDQIPRRSPRWLDSRFESSWTHFHRTDYPRALGDLHTINAPYFETFFFPESLVLQAVIYWKHCRWSRSAAAIAEFDARYPPLKRQVDAVLGKLKDPADFFEHARRITRRRDRPGDEVGRLIRLALGDRSILKNFRHVEELDRELRQVRAADPAWRATAVAAVVLQDLAVQKSLAQADAGQLARQRFVRISREIKNLIKQSIKVRYEIIRGQQEELKASLHRQLVQPSGVAPVVAPDDEHVIWPFTGQYWRDELGSYRVRVSSRCRQRALGRTAAPRLATLSSLYTRASMLELPR